MRNFLILTFLISGFGGFAQITHNPKITKKSTTDTFINKIEITDEYTVVSMQYVSKEPKEALKEYLEHNPEEKEKLSRMNPMMRAMVLQQMMQQMQGTSISIQPTSILKSVDGEEFSFVKANNIPVAPEKQIVEPGKEYFFKVFFKKLRPGIKKIDFMESDRDEGGGLHFWNFYGIEVNNPAKGDEPYAEEENNADQEFVLNGNIFDAVTNQSIAAKIVCKIEGQTQAFDSVQTSRTGYYEFLVNRANYVYTISADGYEPYVQSLELSKWKGKPLKQNFYLQPIEKPLAETKEIEKVDEKTYRLNNVYFPVGKADILEESFAELDKVVEMLKDKPQMRIRVDGHTDNQGDSKLNKLLSIDRAKNVRDYLIGQGITSDRIEFKGWGDTKPVFPNASETERKKNRRVEIVILD